MEEIKYIPLSQAQTGLVNWAAIAPPGLLNLCVKIDILEEIDEKLFMEAVKISVERLSYCRYRIHKNPDGSFCQYESTMEQQDACQFFDFSGYSEKKLDNTLEKWAAEPFPNEIMDVQLYRFRLIRRADGKNVFFFCGHHIIMDIYAVVFTATYMAKVYDALKNGTELPKPGADPEPVVLKQNAFAVSEEMEKERQWTREKFATEPQFTSLNGLGGNEFVKGKRYGKDRSLLQMKSKEFEYPIPMELSNAVKEQAIKLNYSPYVYYIAALRSYLSRVNKTDDVEFMSLTTNRAKLAEKNSGLVSAVGVNFRSVISEDVTFAECLKELFVLHCDYLRHLKMSDPDTCLFVEQYHNVPAGMKYYSIMFSFVSFLDFAGIPLKISAKKIDAGISLAPLYFLIIPTGTDGQLSAFYQIAKGYIKPESVEKFHAFMLKFLKAGVENPEMTIKQLTDMSIQG